MTAITSSKSTRDPIEQACQLHEAAIAFHAKGRNQEAEPLFRRALRLLERTEGKDSPNVAAVLGDLAAFYGQQCQYAQSEQSYERAVGIVETMDGDEDVTRLRLQLWLGLGRVKQWQGNYEEAETYLRRGLTGAEQGFGGSSPEAVEALNWLGMLYKEMGRYTEAGQVYQRALAVVEKARRPDQQMRANLYHNLGGLEHAARNFQRGEPFARRAVELREQALGSDHSDVAADLAALAALLDGQKKYSEAEPLYRRALEIFEHFYGAEHYEVAVNLHNLAALRHAQSKRRVKGALEEAGQLYRRALALREKLCGADHPDVAMTLNNLAAFYKSQKAYAEAEPLYQRALAIFEQKLGAAHPHVPICLDNYAQLLRAMKRLAEARVLETRAKSLRCGLTLLDDEAIAATATINPQLARFALAVRQSPRHGLGVFAVEQIPRGREVIEYTGAKMRIRDAARTAVRSRVYTFRLNKHYCLDGAVGGSGAEYCNHSCDPNLRVSFAGGRIFYESKRRIEAGEELTIDYSFSPKVGLVPCHCGAAKCRGTINRRAEALKKPAENRRK